MQFKSAFVFAALATLVASTPAASHSENDDTLLCCALVAGIDNIEVQLVLESLNITLDPNILVGLGCNPPNSQGNW